MLENDIFKKCKVDLNKLIDYGFKKIQDKYVYETKFLNNSFKCIIEIKDNKITGNVYDLEFNDIYDQFRVKDVIGEFVNNVKEEYIKILIDIRDKCFIPNLFIYDQSNRISKLIKNKYDIDPEFLFDDNSTGVFRNKDNLKWFGIIMNINSSKLDSKLNKDVEVINIKINKDDLDSLLKVNSIYKAYHMNKKSWISIVLDDSLDDSYIMNLIDYSYRSNILFNEWVVPVNMDYFDVEDYYDNHNDPVIKMSSSMNVGDIVYVYLSKPYSCILYKTIIKELDAYHEYEGRFAYVDILKKYNREDITFSKMKELGVGAVRGARRITKELSNYINLV